MSDEDHNATRAQPSPLNHVVDDLSSREQAADWVAGEILAGRTAEEVVEDLMEGGWDAEQATDLVEYVRRATRAERGIVTRDEVVRDAHHRYSRSMGGWFTGLPTFAAAFKLLNSLVTLMRFRRVGQNKRDE